MTDNNSIDNLIEKEGNIREIHLIHSPSFTFDDEGKNDLQREGFVPTDTVYEVFLSLAGSVSKKQYQSIIQLNEKVKSAQLDDLKNPQHLEGRKVLAYLVDDRYGQALKYFKLL